MVDSDEASTANSVIVVTDDLSFAFSATFASCYAWFIFDPGKASLANAHAWDTLGAIFVEPSKGRGVLNTLNRDGLGPTLLVEGVEEWWACNEADVAGLSGASSEYDGDVCARCILLQVILSRVDANRIREALLKRGQDQADCVKSCRARWQSTNDSEELVQWTRRKFGQDIRNILSFLKI
ncbi:hypothetical protein COL5a_001871 [Colletotrichum fioriniae]|nr:hypothetical protein COL5a_001871 [Colletotrichum fioriniae]